MSSEKVYCMLKKNWITLEALNKPCIHHVNIKRLIKKATEKVEI